MGLPRTRGDGPDTVNDYNYIEQSPPHPRGWSAPGFRRNGRPRVSPAPAGMVRRSPSANGSSASLPRTRGDGPHDIDVNQQFSRSPPHPRGWSRDRGSEPVSGEVSPAPAGMVRRFRKRAAHGTGLPRTRGDGPDTGAVAGRDAKSPPHPRGWSELPAAIPSRSQVSPAPAGMVRTRATSRRRAERLPRTRGDGPLAPARWWRASASPPHPRGWSVLPGLSAAEAMVSPAPAGMVRRWAGADRFHGSLPRTRGDGPRSRPSAPALTRSPPHPRGWSAGGAAVLCGVWVSPAPAGMVP